MGEPMDDYQKGIQLGLRAAATFLESEAEDLEQRRAGQVVMMSAKELADWLRVQAEEVRQLRVQRGR
jgi:hypothetical protein